MKSSRLMKKLGAILLVIFSLILVACDRRDISTVENAIEGHWDVTDVRVNDEPLEEVLQEFDQWLEFDEDAVSSTEQGTQAIALDFYYEDGILAIENAEGDVTTLPYIVEATDEANHTLTLAYHIVDEEVDITLNEVIRFNTEERNSYTSEMQLVDIQMTPTASEEEVSDLERELNQIGQDLAGEILKALDIEINAVYVDDADAPEDTNE